MLKLHSLSAMYSICLAMYSMSSLTLLNWKFIFCTRTHSIRMKEFQKKDRCSWLFSKKCFSRQNNLTFISLSRSVGIYRWVTHARTNGYLPIHSSKRPTNNGHTVESHTANEIATMWIATNALRATFTTSHTHTHTTHITGMCERYVCEPPMLTKRQQWLEKIVPGRVLLRIVIAAGRREREKEAREVGD